MYKFYQILFDSKKFFLLQKFINIVLNLDNNSKTMVSSDGSPASCSNKNSKCNTKIPMPKKTSARQRRHALRSIRQLAIKKASSR
jgi:hypothetical protein